MIESFDLQLRTRVVFGEGSFDRLGDIARQLGFTRTLLVADAGMVDAGYAARAAVLLAEAGVDAAPFHEFGPNPDGLMIEAGRDVAAERGVDSIIGLGGGSSLDCAKGVNFIVTNGGSVADYRGYGKASKPMLPMLAVPTTAGTGSEAQSYAILSDPGTHAKMACGDPKAAFRAAILDPLLTVSQPPSVTAAAGLDAIAHAVETWVTTRRNAASDLFAREAWRLLEANYERVLGDPLDLDARGAMLLGAHWAGAAIEHSMLGAAHACANPLTAHYDVVHGVAVGIMLPHVVRWNGSASAAPRYAELLGSSRWPWRQGDAAEGLAARLQALAARGGLPGALSAVGVPYDDLSMLAHEAATQWTGQFNPRPLDASGALEIYECAY